MTPTTALELKEAGWPQDKGNRPTCAMIPSGSTEFAKMLEEPVYPTLTQLIEACGNVHYSLTRCTEIEGYGFPKDGDWLVRCIALGKGKDTFHSSSPEEAIAHLWIELNKK